MRAPPPRPRSSACGRCAPAGAGGMHAARAHLRSRLQGRSCVSAARLLTPVRPARVVGSGLVRRAPRHMGARAGAPWVLVCTPGMGGGSGAPHPPPPPPHTHTPAARGCTPLLRGAAPTHAAHHNKGAVVHLVPGSGHCGTFSSTVPPLQVALSFACSVASLSHSPSLQLPGWHGLHHGSLADYLLGWGRASTCLAGLARTPVHAHAQAP